MLIFLTFSVILVTLVGAALTLPAVVSWLKVEDDDVGELEEKKALGAMAAAAIARVDELERRRQLEPHIAGGPAQTLPTAEGTRCAQPRR